MALAYLTLPWWTVYLARSHLPDELSVLKAEVSYPGLTQLEVQSAQFELSSLGLQVKLSQLSTDYSLNEVIIGSASISGLGKPSSKIQKLMPIPIPKSSLNPLAVLFDLINQIIKNANAMERFSQLKIKKLTLTFSVDSTVPLKQIVIENLNVIQANGKIRISAPLLNFLTAQQDSVLNRKLQKPSAIDLELDLANESLVVNWISHDTDLVSAKYEQKTDKQTIQLKVHSAILNDLWNDMIFDGSKIKDEFLVLDIDKIAETNRVSLGGRSRITLDKNSLNQWLSSNTNGSTKNKITPSMSVLKDIESEIELDLQLNESRLCTLGSACGLSLSFSLKSPLVLSNTEDNIIADKVEVTFDSSFSSVDIASSDSLFNLLKGEINLSANELNWEQVRVQPEVKESHRAIKSSLDVVNFDVSLVLSLPKTSMLEMLDGHWSLKAEVSATKLDASFQSDDSKNENEQALIDRVSILANTGGIAEFNMVYEGELVSSGRLEFPDLQIDSTLGTAKASGSINWLELNEKLSKGSARVKLELQAPKFSEFTFDTALITANMQASENMINGGAGFSFNDIPVSPVEIKYSKHDQSTVLLFSKEEINLEVLNHLLSIVGEQQKLPLQILSGSVTHSGDLLLAKSALLSSQLDADKISVLFGENTVNGLRLNQVVTSFSPKIFESNLQIESIDFSSGLQITEISAEIVGRLIDGKENLDFSKIDAKILNGELNSKSVRFVDLEMQPSEIALTGLSLEALFDFMDVSGLTADGVIDLSIPFSSFNGQLIVVDGKFQSVGKGIIRYSTEVEQNISEKNIVFQALDNFHYESIDGDISYDKDGYYLIKLHLLGSNPEFYDGYPIDFTLNLNGQLTGIFRSLFLTGNFEQAVLDQVDAQRRNESDEF